MAESALWKWLEAEMDREPKDLSEIEKLRMSIGFAIHALELVNTQVVKQERQIKALKSEIARLKKSPVDAS